MSAQWHDGNNEGEVAIGIENDVQVAGEPQCIIDIENDDKKKAKEDAEQGDPRHGSHGLAENTVAEIVGSEQAGEQGDHASGVQQRSTAVAEVTGDKHLKILRDFIEEVAEEGEDLLGVSQRGTVVGEVTEDRGLKSPQGSVEEVGEELGTTITVHKLPHFLLEESKECSEILIFCLGSIALVTGIKEEGLNRGSWVGFAIIGFWIFRVLYASASSLYNAIKTEKILNQKNQAKVEVIRCQQSGTIQICDIKVGNIVCLKKGSMIPADGQIECDNGLVLDGALSKKRGCPFLYFGAKVLDGEGFMRVTSVGADMEFSKLMSSVTSVQDNKLLHEARLDKPIPYADVCDLKKKMLLDDRVDKSLAWLGYFAVITVIICVLVEFVRFLNGKNKKNNPVQELKSAVGVDWLTNISQQLLDVERLIILAASMSTVVFVLQHGIKIVSTCLDKRGCKLSARRTMGIAPVFCMDMSGGLMSDKREVGRFYIGDKDANDGNCSKVSQTVLEPLRRGVGASVLVDENGSCSRTDDCLISSVEKMSNINIKSELSESFSFATHKKLSSNKEGRGVLLQKKGNGESIWYSHWKGAASTILDMCSDYYDCGGQIHGIENGRSKFEQVVKAMEDEGMRPIAFAYKQTKAEELAEVGLCLLALVGVKYLCHEEMKSAVRGLRHAGKTIKLVSKDKLSTVRAMAWGIGLSSPNPNDVAIEGQEFRNWAPDAMAERLDQITMVGSCSPEDKLFMVKSLKEKNHIVAFLGGWSTREAPVLLEADVGITIGPWSTEMTKKISDIVLTSAEGLGSLNQMSESGRLDYHKLQMFNQIEFISNISISVITAAEVIWLGKPSITILGGFYMNVVLAVSGGLMMLLIKQLDEKLRNNQPCKRNASIMAKAMWINILLLVLYLVIVLLVFQFKERALPIPGIDHMNPEVRRAMIFNGLFLCQLFSFFHPLYEGGKYHLWLILGLFTPIHVVGFTKLCMKLNLTQWVYCFLFALLSPLINTTIVLISTRKSRPTDLPVYVSRQMQLPRS